jgi:hypothetical protein
MVILFTSFHTRSFAGIDHTQAIFDKLPSGASPTGATVFIHPATNGGSDSNLPFAVKVGSTFEASIDAAGNYLSNGSLQTNGDITAGGAGAFHGSGSGLSNVPGASITGSHTLADSVLSVNLTGIGGLTSAADKVPYFTSTGGAAALATFTAAGRALVDDADAAAQRTTLGLGTLATQSGTFSTILGTFGALANASGWLHNDGSGVLAYSTPGFDATNPMTTLGDMIYGGSSGTGTRLAGNTTSTKKFMSQTGDGVNSNIPGWAIIVAGDVPDISATYQPRDSDLDTYATLPPSANFQTLSGHTFAQMRDDLDVEAGVNVQAYNANLAAIAGLTSAADKLPYFTGSGTAALADFTSAGRALVDDADAAAQRTTLGVGNASTPTFAGVLLSGLTASLPVITDGSKNLASHKIDLSDTTNYVTGVLAAAGMPALSGDISNSAGSLTTAIGANKVTLGMLATIAQDRIIGGATGAGTATPTALSVLPTGCVPAFTGDVTNSAGSLAMAIGAGKVTNTMLAGSIDLTAKVTGVLPTANGGWGIAGSVSSVNLMNAALYVPFETATPVNAINDLTVATVTGAPTVGYVLDTATYPRRSIGKAMTFDGSNDYITFSPSTLFDQTTGDFTCACWFKTNTTGSQGIFEKLQTASPNAGYIIRMINTGASYDFDIEYRGATGQVSATITTSVARSNQWHHLVGVFDKTNNLFTLYLDGSSAGTTSLSSGTGSLTNTGLLHIGSNWQGGNKFNGSIDEAYMWNYPLSASQARALYFQTSSPTPFAPATVDFAAAVDGALTLNRTATPAGNPAWAANYVGFTTTGIGFEGATANTSEGNLVSADITGDQVWTLPDATGTVAVSASGNVQEDSAGNITTIASPSFTNLTLSGFQKNGTWHLRYIIRKTGITNNTATGIFSITTTNESGSNDGGSYGVRVTVHAASTSGASEADTSKANCTNEYTWSRAMVAAGTGTNSAITTIVSGAANATDGNTVINNGFGPTLVEASEYETDFKTQVNLSTNTNSYTVRVTCIIDLEYEGFLTAPVIAAL